MNPSRTPSLRTAAAASTALAVALAALGGVAHGRRLVGATPAALFHGGAAPVAIGPVPRGLSATSPEACAPCHAEIAREWTGSLHSQSWTDPVFRAAYAVEPLAFCRNCHAPSMRAGAREPDARAAREGVSCAVCHVRAGHVLGAGRGGIGGGGGGGGGGGRAHPEMARASFTQSGYCAGCHQFNFPAGRAGAFATDEPMQDTYAEWAASRAAAPGGASCQDCHMPWRTRADGTRYRSHAFPGARDAGLLARAVRVEVRATRRGDGPEVVLRARLEPGEIGHAFPTGDLFRRGELVAWLEGGDGAAAAHATLARAFGDRLERGADGRPHSVRREVDDTRVAPPPREAGGAGGATSDPARVVELRVRAARGARVRWALDHLLMPAALANAQGFAPGRNRARMLEGVVVAP